MGIKFNSRPVSETRCDAPELGAIQYNEARAKFKAKVKESVKPAHVHEFIELVRWAIDSGDLAQRKIVLAMTIQRLKSGHYGSSQLISISRITGPIKNTQRFRVSVELRQELIASIERAG